MPRDELQLQLIDADCSRAGDLIRGRGQIPQHSVSFSCLFYVSTCISTVS